MQAAAARVTRQPMSAATADDLKLLFLDARTHNAFAPEAPDDATLARLYELVRMGPTSMNCQPLRVLFQNVPEAKAAKNRVHLDVRVGDDSVDGVVERLTARGATFLHRGQQGPYRWTTMADPEGNEFCVT